MRADAQRNRAHILDAARSLLASRGTGVSMDEIARRAGVAVGTLYRHFPTKTDMVRAVHQGEVDYMVEAFSAAGVEIAAGARALETTALTLDDTTRRMCADRSLKRAVERLGMTLTADDLVVVVRELGVLVQAMQQEGTVRDDVAVGDLVLLLRGMPIDDVDETTRRRWLHLILRSLATAEGSRRLDSLFTQPVRPAQPRSVRR